jgi:two-component system sensor histidine kinase DesK
MWDYLRLEVRRTLRDAGFVIGGVAMPVLMYLLFTNLGGNSGDWRTGAMVGMAGYGAVGSALNTGGGVAEDRAIGWLRQLRVTPMTPRQVVIGRTLTGSVTVLPAIVAVLAAGGLVNGVRLDVWQWAAIAGLLWLGSVPFTLLGLGNGYRAARGVPVHAHLPIRRAGHLGRRGPGPRARGDRGARPVAAGLRFVRCAVLPAIRPDRLTRGDAMSWMRGIACRLRGLRAAHTRWQAEAVRLRAEQREARRAGRTPLTPGPPPSGFTLLPWLLMGLGSFSNLLQGETDNPLLAGLGLLAFNSLYVYVTFRSFAKDKRRTPATRVALALMTAVTCALAIGYGDTWLYFFPLLGLAAGAALRGPWLGRAALGLTALATAVSIARSGWNASLNVAYGTFLSTMVTAAILSLSETVRELHAAREKLALQAVEKERLRFSRDLHDLLGHTMSVIVVKSEAARRLAPRNLDAAIAQITDIESVGRQALAEIREAVTGYREGSLATELDRARSVLSAAAIEPVVTRSGAPLAPQSEALLGWVVREAVTNVLRHSGATRCRITVNSTPERARLTVTDNGAGGTAEGGPVRSADGGTPAPGAEGDRGGLAPGAGDGGRYAPGTGEGSRPAPDTGDDSTPVPGTGDGGRPAPGAGDDRRTADRGPSAPGVGGTGLKGLTERLAAAGGSLKAGPGSRGGFTVTAELPLEPGESADLALAADGTADGR